MLIVRLISLFPPDVKKNESLVLSRPEIKMIIGRIVSMPHNPPRLKVYHNVLTALPRF